ncbi:MULTISPECIES: glycosyltransferase family 4 protein [unclassified Thalassospira]|uniref:glycosyltransferase family 4 protein n=1 Tax=unclassified Thalassospira TaxID=2648997 RepID=UPI00117C362C|nr:MULTISPECIES: glycosyltransferase family 4 protein [unclassified Thalassospira]
MDHFEQEKMKQAKRLVLFFTFDVSLQTWLETGLFAREVELYRRLIKNGWDVTFLTYGTNNDLELAKKISPIKVVPLFKKWRPSNPIIRLVLSPFLIFKARKLIKNCSVLKTNQIWGGWNAVLARWVWGRPLVVRGGYEPYAFSIHQNQPKPRQIFTKLMTGLCYRNADAVFLATKEDLDFAKTHFSIHTQEIYIRSNWVDTEHFRPSLKKRSALEILYVGRFNSQKNLTTLIKSLANSDYILHLVGDGEQRHELEELAEKVSVSAIFHGRLPNDVLSKFMAEFEIFALPSLFEGNPKVLIESMSAGLAIAATDSPGINSLIRHNETGVLCPPSEEGLRRAIDSLAASKNFRMSIGKKARSYILEHHSLTSFANEEERILSSLAEKKYDET